MTTTFTNYGEKTLEDIDFSLSTPNGWSVEAKANTHFDKLTPGNSVDIEWQVTIPATTEPGFTALDVNASFKYDGKKKQHTLSTASTIRVVPKPPTSNAYLSDMEWTDATNHWGPVERDQSVGGKELNDGKMLTIGGVKYEKGLGVHAISEVSYYLGGNFSTFTADVGIDDEVGDKGSAVFQVWGDGEKIYDSGVVIGSDPAGRVQVDISGVNELKLYVTDADGGRQNDHADWGNAFVSNPLPAQDTYLSDVDWIGAVNHWGPVEKDQSVGEIEMNDGNTISIGGVKYKKGLGVHAYSKATYNLGSNFARFTADVGVDDEVGEKGSVVFEVWADGEKIYDSGVVTGSDSAKQIDVDITGKKILDLVVTDAGDGTRHDHASWGDAYISRNSASASE